MFFASIFFHCRHLNEVMYGKCSFRASAFFKGVTDKLLKCLRIAYPWDATKFTPKLIGIPPHVMLMADMGILRCKFDALRADIKGNMEDIMDERGFGG